MSERKVIVCESQLDLLLASCRTCRSAILDTKKTLRGSALSVVSLCAEGHRHTWHSQPKIGATYVSNLLLAAAIVLSGSLFTSISSFASPLHLPFIGKSFFYKIQSSTIWPVVDFTWRNHVGSIQICCGGDEMCVIGDGRSGGPGRSAKYGMYTVMDQATEYILVMEVVHVSETDQNSKAMEPEGLRRILKRLHEASVAVSMIATDRSPSVRTVLRDEFPGITHQYDVWHFAKSIHKNYVKFAPGESLTT